MTCGEALGAFCSGKRRRIGHVDDRDLMLRIGRAVGVGQVDLVARQNVRHIEVESRRRSGDRGARRRLIGQRTGKRGGHLIDLRLRLHQGLVAQFQVGSDLSRTDRIVRDHVEVGAIRQLDRERPDAGFGRIAVVQRIGVQRSRRRECHLGGLAVADELNAGIGKDAGLVGGVGDGPDIHQFRELVDRAIALIHQRRGGRIGRTQSLQLHVDLGDLGHGRVGLDHRVADILFDVRAQRLDARRRCIQLLRQRLRRRQRRDLRRLAARICRQRLQCRGEIAQRRFQRTAAAGRPVDVLQLAQNIRHLVGVGATGGFRAQLALDVDIELAVDAGDLNARARAAAGDLDLVDALADIARRLRIRDIRRYDRKRGLVGAQAGHRSGEG